MLYYYYTTPKAVEPETGAPKAVVTKQAKYARFQESMDTFVSRMVEGTAFHGGQGPDAVDFRVYSWLHRYSHTFTMKSLLFARGGKQDKLIVWYDRMDRLTKNQTNL